MNIFVLDLDPKRCAQDHTDEHVEKMLVQYAQMLYTAHTFLDGEGTALVRVPSLHRVTDPKTGVVNVQSLRPLVPIYNPCVKWVRESSENYKWLHSLFSNLCGQFKIRNGFAHSYETSALDVKLARLPQLIPMGERTPHPMIGMNNDRKQMSVVETYRDYYYAHVRTELARWYGIDDPPQWWKERAHATT